MASSVIAVLAASAGMVRFPRSTIVRASEMGMLRVESNPTGLPVLVDGLEQGRTPARLSVSAGTHVLEVRGRNAPRVMPISVASGVEHAQYIEFPDVPQTGHLRVDSDPAGATVMIDGVSRGTTPLTVRDLTPGPREIVLQTAAGSEPHTVNIQAGATSSLTAPAPRFRSVRTADVVPGKLPGVAVKTPAGVVSLDASPAAEIWIDGRRIGETPLANLSVPAGEHEVVFRHSQLGDKRQVLRVNPGARLGLSVQMK
jgi:hypothetical protein